MVTEEDYFMLKDLAREQEQATGRINISELARETGFDRKTVRRYLSLDRPPETPRTRNKLRGLKGWKFLYTNEYIIYPIEYIMYPCWRHSFPQGSG